jgi:hypothetical protein
VWARLIFQTEKDISNRCGCLLAIGSVHRYMAAMDVGRHLQSTVSILQTVAADAQSGLQVCATGYRMSFQGLVNPKACAIHSYTLVVDAAGLEFAPFLRPTLALVSGLIFCSSVLDAAVLQSAGKVRIKATQGLDTCSF